MDAADRGPAGVTEARIGYYQDLTSYIVSKANSITVLGGGAVMRQRSASFQSGTGNLLEVVKTLASGAGAVTDLTYDCGGVPAITVPDNLKSGIRQADRYEAEPNSTYREMAAHYGTCIIPARVRRPRDKEKASYCTLFG